MITVFFIGRLVFEAKIDLWQTSLKIVSDQVSRLTEVANLCYEVDFLTVWDCRDACPAVRSDVVAARAFITGQSLRRFRGSVILGAVLNFGQALFQIGGCFIAVIAKLAGILIAEIGSAVVDFD